MIEKGDLVRPWGHCDDPKSIGVVIDKYSGWGITYIRVLTMGGKFIEKQIGEYKAIGK